MSECAKSVGGCGDEERVDVGRIGARGGTSLKRMSKVQPMSTSSYAWVTIMVCWPFYICSIAVYSSCITDHLLEGIVARPVSSIADERDESLSNTSSNSLSSSLPPSRGCSVGVGVRIHLELQCTIIPINHMVSIPKGVVRPTISWPCSQSARPIPLISRMM